MVTGWQPATDLERALLTAVEAGDQAGYLRLLSTVRLLVPVQQDADGNSVGFVTSASGGRTFLLGYTSSESLAVAAAGREVPCLTTSLRELAGRWPDPRWWLAVNLGTPIEGYLPPERVAAPTLDLGTDATTRLPTPPKSPPMPQPAAPQPAAPVAAEPEPAPEVPEPAAEPATAEPVAAAAPEPVGQAPLESLPPTTRSGQEFVPANAVEQTLLAATEQGDSDRFLKAVLLAELVVPLAEQPPHGGIRPDAPAFPWRRYRSEQGACIPVFTSVARCAEALGGGVPTVSAEAVAVLLGWPGDRDSMVLNPGSQVGATLPGQQVLELRAWADEVGLVDVLREFGPDVESPDSPRLLQKLLSADQAELYLERGYDLVSGLAHLAELVDPTGGPAAIRAALGDELPAEFVLRWRCPEGGYRPLTGQPAPQAPVEQVRLSGVQLPHGATLARLEHGRTVVVASYDADLRQWRPVTGG